MFRKPSRGTASSGTGMRRGKQATQARSGRRSARAWSASGAPGRRSSKVATPRPPARWTLLRSSNGLAIANRALFDDSLSISRNELRLGWFTPDLQVSAGYLWLDSDLWEDRLDDVSELTMAGGWRVSDGWWATTETRYDFTADRAQRTLVGLEYRNECITVEMSLARRFTSSGEVRPEAETIVAKSHMPYALSPARMARWRALFLQPDYAVEQLPGYAPALASNPFLAFRDLPVKARYRFMLEEGSGRAACRGRV